MTAKLWLHEVQILGRNHSIDTPRTGTQMSAAAHPTRTQVVFLLVQITHLQSGMAGIKAHSFRTRPTGVEIPFPLQRRSLAIFRSFFSSLSSPILSCPPRPVTERDYYPPRRMPLFLSRSALFFLDREHRTWNLCVFICIQATSMGVH